MLPRRVCKRGGSYTIHAKAERPGRPLGVLRAAIGVGACLVIGLSAAGADEDWVQFRGNQAQGLADARRLPTVWSDKTNIAWKRGIPGKGWSSPVLKQGRVYLTTAVPLAGDDQAAQSLRALCLDAETGEIAWNVEVFEQPPGQRIHSKNSHASPTPIIDEDRLYVHFGTQGTACLKCADGKAIWKTRELVYEPVHGGGGSPLLVNGLLVLNCDGGNTQFVAALDKQTGNLVWKSERNLDPAKGFSFCTPLLIDVEGRPQIISAGSEAVVAYEPATGKPLWMVRYRGYSVVPRPVYGNGLLYVCTGYDSPTLLAIDPRGASGDATETHVAWRLTKRVPLNPSPLLAGQRLYLVSDDGVATCLEAQTGRQIWQQRVGGEFSASPVYAGGRLYLQSEQGEGIVLEAADQFREIARNPVEERSLASYAVSGDALFIRTQGHLLRVQEMNQALAP